MDLLNKGRVTKIYINAPFANSKQNNFSKHEISHRILGHVFHESRALNSRTSGVFVPFSLALHSSGFYKEPEPLGTRLRDLQVSFHISHNCICALCFISGCAEEHQSCDVTDA